MQITEKASKEIIEILHNLKSSCQHDFLEMLNNFNREGHSSQQLAANRKNIEKDSSSIFEHQPTSEYSQQPFPHTTNDSVASNEEKEDDMEKSDQITTDERETIVNEKRRENIEKQRADYEGFLRDNR